MKFNLLFLSLVILLAGLLGVPLFAHHGTVEYQSKMIVLTGTVAEFEFTNPHILIHIDADDGSGNVQHWTVETSPPSLAIRDGWSKDMMKPGDRISYSIRPAKNGVLIGRGGSKIVVNGKTFGQ